MARSRPGLAFGDTLRTPCSACPRRRSWSSFGDAGRIGHGAGRNYDRRPSRIEAAIQRGSLCCARIGRIGRSGSARHPRIRPYRSLDWPWRRRARRSLASLGSAMRGKPEAATQKRAHGRRPGQQTERFHCPTWHDYLRQRSRSTASERALHIRAVEFHIGPEPIRIRRMLERPIGSVRWKEDTPDRSAADVVPITSPGAGP